MALNNICKDQDVDYIAIEAVTASDLDLYIKNQSPELGLWIANSLFAAQANTVLLLPDASGAIAKVLLGLGDGECFWSYASLAKKLPAGNYKIMAEPTAAYTEQSRSLAWLLGCYQYDAYKYCKPVTAQLVVGPSVDLQALESMYSSICLVRDLVNTPADDLGPEQLAQAVAKVAEEVGASYSEIVDQDLLKENYPMVYHVGRGAEYRPRLAILEWGAADKPLIALVGKGVCFDAGGLQLKSSASILDMKKDMGGAAHALALARLIIQANLPVRVRLLVPCVENSISGSAYRPRDVLTARDSQTVEVNNTDAEGRLILADALTAQIEQDPAVLINFATLTGAGRVALGPEIPALMSNCKQLQQDVWQISESIEDLVWPLPLYAGYNHYLKSEIADISNVSDKVYGGAITAGLFLQHFVPSSQPWLHFDLMAGNVEDLPGRPKGGDAQGLRTMLQWCREKFSG